MAESKKILTSEFKREWNGPNGVLYYHDVTFAEGEKPWSIGTKEKDPMFLLPGQNLDFEVKDAAKRSIKRVKLDTPVSQQSGSGGGSSGRYNPIGQIVGASVNNAVLLAAHGKIHMDDLRKTAKGLVEFSLELQKSFE